MSQRIFSHPLPRTLFGAGLLSLAGLALAIAAAQGSRGDSGTHPVVVAAPSPAIQQSLFTARDFAFDAPAMLPSGPVMVTLQNQGQQVHHAIALRLNDGVSVEQFTASLLEGPEAALKLATLRGGPETAEPGRSTSVTLDLTPGTYVFLCAVQDNEGVPHFARGMIHTLDVATTASSAPTPEPLADVRVRLRDFSFALSTPPPAGPQTWEIVNEGQQPHELTLYTLLPGKTFDDLLAYAQNPSGPRPVARVSSVQMLANGTRSWLDLDLPAGGYALVCTVPDPETGKEHVDLGMLSTFTVGQR